MSATTPDQQSLQSFKIVMEGNRGSGVSSLQIRYCKGHFKDYYVTIASAFQSKTVNVDDKPVTLDLWHVVGRERFHSFSPMYFRGAHGIILVYDITNKDSFDAIPKWIGDIEQHVGTSTVFMIVGNKCDLEKERIISQQQGKEMADQHNALWMEASAKTDTNVDQIFAQMAQMLKKKCDDGDFITKEVQFDLDQIQVKEGNYNFGFWKLCFAVMFVSIVIIVVLN